MRTLAVIPARLGATRLPRKPLRLLAGIPLVVRVAQRVQSLGLFGECIVATDTDEVARECRAHGIEAILTDPRHPSGTDRVAEVVALPRFSGVDAIANIQGDEPFVSTAAVTGAMQMVTTGAFALGTAAARADRDALGRPDMVKVVAGDDGRAMYFSRAPIPFLRDPMDANRLEGRILHHIGVYAYAREALARWVALPPHPLELIERLEQLRPLAAGMAMGVAVIHERPRPGIDTEDDLARANSDWTSFADDRSAGESATLTGSRR